MSFRNCFCSNRLRPGWFSQPFKGVWIWLAGWLGDSQLFLGWLWSSPSVLVYAVCLIRVWPNGKLGFWGGASGKDHPHQWRRCSRCWPHLWAGKIPWRRARNTLQCSCLENCMDRGAWRAAVHRVDSQTRPSNLAHTWRITNFVLLLPSSSRRKGKKRLAKTLKKGRRSLLLTWASCHGKYRETARQLDLNSVLTVKWILVSLQFPPSELSVLFYCLLSITGNNLSILVS